MPASLIRRIFRGWSRHESYWDSQGMNENLKFIGDHLPGLDVIGLDIDPLPSSAAQGAAVLHTSTGEYSIYSMDAAVASSGWTRYPASAGILSSYNGVTYVNSGSAWSTSGSGIAINPGSGISISGTGSPSSPYVISATAKSSVVNDIADFSITNSSAPGGGEGRFSYTTQAGAWNIGAGRMSFSADLKFSNYFAANPNGHMAIVLRQDPSLISVAVRGNGVAIGNLIGATEGTKINPGAQIEFWANGVNPQQNRLVPGAESPKQLVDGKNYKILIESSVAEDGNRYARAAIYEQVDRGYDCVFDTGDVLDTLAGADFTKTGLLIGHVFGSNASGWSIDFTNSKVTWGPFDGKKSDTSNISTKIEAAFLERVTDNLGYAYRPGFTMPSTSTRTWATVALDSGSVNPTFGSWNAAKTEFTFSKSGAYMINVTGPIGVFYNATSLGGQIGVQAYLDLGAYTQWVGGVSGVVAVGSGLIESGWCGASVPFNATAGQVIKLVMTTESTGVTSATAVFGVAGGVFGGGNAFSGITIVYI